MKRVRSFTLVALLLLFLLLNLVSCGKDPAADYLGHEVSDGSYEIGGTTYPFYYSDGFFEVVPTVYSAHLSTSSFSLSHAAAKKPEGDDHARCADEITSVLGQIGFESIYVTDSFTETPTADSVACVIATKQIENRRGVKRVVSITFRSGGFKAEWSSDFVLGPGGEAKGIADSADKAVEVYLYEYLFMHPALTEAIERGEVAFWVQGYSRGAAVANLTAKRLVDLYGAKGNDVFAYCFGGQNAGVAEAEIEGNDYSSIHNVVNPIDPIVYLAPASMGFKRYGVDHVLFKDDPDAGEDADPASEERLALLKKQLLALFGDEQTAESYMPKTVVYKGLNLVSKEIIDIERPTGTAAFIEAFANGIAVTPDGETVTDRETYVGKMEAELSRLMGFLNTEFADFREIQLDLVSLKQTVSEAASECRDTLMKNLYVNAYGKATVNFHSSAAKKLTDALYKRLRENGEVRELLSDYPDGGADRGIKDLARIVYGILFSATDVDDLITFGFNFVSLTSNHEYAQTLAALMSYDSWFESSLKD